MNEPCIVLCPCCASAVDALSHPELQELTCPHCGQRWLMGGDAQRLAAHSLT